MAPSRSAAPSQTLHSDAAKARSGALLAAAAVAAVIAVAAIGIDRRPPRASSVLRPAPAESAGHAIAIVPSLASASSLPAPASASAPSIPATLALPDPRDAIYAHAEHDVLVAWQSQPPASRDPARLQAQLQALRTRIYGAGHP